MQEIEIILKSLELNNFCGSGSEKVDFFEKITNIAADNGVGKTRLNHAFNYLFFDKNAEDRKDFNIKNTIDLSKNRQESEVVGVIKVNGSEITLRKVYKEKWQKKQGSKETVFTGNETEYFYNEVPCSKAEYKSKIDSLIQEELFKLVTNVSYFNKLQWKVQRDFILKLVPEVTDSEIAQGSKDFEDLLSSLTNGKTMAEYKKEISSKKSKLKDELKDIPGRIDEVKRGKPEPEDYELVQKSIDELNVKIAGIETKINDKLSGQKTLAAEQREQHVIVNGFEYELQQLGFELNKELSEKSNELAAKKTSIRNAISQTEAQIKLNIDRLAVQSEANLLLDKNILELRADFEAANSSSFTIDEDATKCPSCMQELPNEVGESKIEEIKNTFIAKRKARLDSINKQGLALSESKRDGELKVLELKNSIETLETDLSAKKEEFRLLSIEVLQTPEEVILASKEYADLKAKIDAERAKLTEVKPIDQTELKAEKEALNRELDLLKLKLNSKKQIEDADNRTKELETKESTLSQELADLELVEFNINAFDKARMDRVESQINDKFKYVTFKLFDVQVNGAEVPMCEAQIGGVPYSDANTAARIVAGLDVIETLSNHYKIHAPIFLDEKESITRLPEINSQLITLGVAEGVTELSVSGTN